MVVGVTGGNGHGELKFLEQEELQQVPQETRNTNFLDLQPAPKFFLGFSE